MYAMCWVTFGESWLEPLTDLLKPEDWKDQGTNKQQQQQNLKVHAFM